MPYCVSPSHLVSPWFYQSATWCVINADCPSLCLSVRCSQPASRPVSKSVIQTLIHSESEMYSVFCLVTYSQPVSRSVIQFVSRQGNKRISQPASHSVGGNFKPLVWQTIGLWNMPDLFYDAIVDPPWTCTGNKGLYCYGVSQTDRYRSLCPLHAMQDYVSWPAYGLPSTLFH